MRDVNRIDGVMKRLGDLWRKFCPDWRFGQLMFNFEHWHVQAYHMDIFSLEDDMLPLRFEEFLVQACGKPGK